MTAKRWMSAAPKKCDLCSSPLIGVFIDGRTNLGAWCIMCVLCHDDYGRGVGEGCGQIYELKTLVKLEG